MTDEKRASVSLTTDAQNLGDLRKFVRLADRLSVPDTAPVDLDLGRITIRTWMSRTIVPRARGTAP